MQRLRNREPCWNSGERMSKQNENRQGYEDSRTKELGGWQVKKLSSLLLEKPDYGANSSSIEFDDKTTYRYIRITDINDQGDLIEDNKVGIPIEIGKDYLLQDGDVVIARTGASVGKSYIYHSSDGNCAFAGYLIRLRVDQKKILSQFLFQFLHSPQFWKWVRGTVKIGAQPNISAEEYSSLKIIFPIVIDKQDKIVTVLSSWDKSIKRIAALTESKTKLKKALMQQLLTGKLRFKEFSKIKFHRIVLGEFLIPTSRPVPRPNSSYTALGIRSHGKGTFLKTIENPETVMMDTLYKVRENDLIVNITFAWEGAIAIVKKSDEGVLVSHRFPTYVFNRVKVIPEYFNHVIQTKRFVHELGLVSPGGAGRNRVMSKTDFHNIFVSIPSIAEQKKIAVVLNGIDKEIELLGKKLEYLKTQKKGLMQKLLTGKIRVKV
jgi:type I restriction enzyme, S subunit